MCVSVFPRANVLCPITASAERPLHHRLRKKVQSKLRANVIHRDWKK